MPTNLNLEKENARFFHILKRVLRVFVVLTAFFLASLTYTVLNNEPAYMHDWRGITCIFLSIVALLIYSYHLLFGFRWNWPPPLSYALSLWGGIYLSVFLLTCINNSFVWIFYIVVALSLGLFPGRRLLLAGGVAALTMFAFEGVLWPTDGETLMALVSQTLSVSSMIGFNLLFQHMMKERFERNSLLQQLARANTELEEAHQQLAQSVSQQQELAVLRERTRLAREMHDTIGHALVLISVKLEAAQRLRDRDPERCDRELESTKGIARGAMTALRASIANLRSPAIEHEHIYHALSRSAGELAQRIGLQVTCNLPAETENLPEALAETLWKVSQEAFTNIEKHAQAKSVEVEIRHQDTELLMRIRDDGIGLPPAVYNTWQEPHLTSKGHYGLHGILERVEALQGHLTLHSAQEEGTTIEIHLPLPQQSHTSPPLLHMHPVQEHSSS